MPYTTQKQVRQAFWDSFPEFKPDFQIKKRQNDYKCDIRVSFVDFVDSLRRNGDISEKLANNVTL
jgi:hypothetical protein